MLLNKNKALKLIELLNKSIKNPKTSLKYRNQFTLLTSVVLSAQCTDLNVNNVTKSIYKKYYTPKHFAELGINKIRNLIKSIGLFNNKIENIELKHTAFSRELFVDGALKAAIWISKKNKGLFDMQDMLNLK